MAIENRADAYRHLAKCFRSYRESEGRIRPDGRRKLCSGLKAAVQGFELGFGALSDNERRQLGKLGGPDVFEAVAPPQPPLSAECGRLALLAEMSLILERVVWDVAGLKRTEDGRYIFPRAPRDGEGFIDTVRRASIVCIYRMPGGEIFGNSAYDPGQMSGYECLWLYEPSEVSPTVADHTEAQPRAPTVADHIEIRPLASPTVH